MEHMLARVFAVLLFLSNSAQLKAADPPGGAVALTTGEIRQVFANVKDEAEVQDAAGTHAVNYWYSDGTFTNTWRNANASGEVAGRWWARDGKRCVMITAGLPAREGVAQCSPVYRRGDHYLSIEPDGRIHGIHRLSTID